MTKRRKNIEEIENKEYIDEKMKQTLKNKRGQQELKIEFKMSYKTEN